jgi:deazaflavin-dependent oxidoreductase (nitroreductase family)
MWFNPIMRWLIKSPLHFFVSKNMMLMTYQGRKSGKSYTTPMNYLEIEGALYTISYRKRVWWRNLRGGAAVTLRLRGVDVPARAEVIEDPPQVSSSLQQYLKAAPEYARYLNVQIDSAGNPKPEDLDRLTNERVVVLSLLK